MKLLKRTREADRITANIRVHAQLMDKHVAAGESRQDASRLALMDLQSISTAERINQANEMRRANDDRRRTSQM